MYLNSIWLNLNSIPIQHFIKIELNWIQIQLKTIGTQIDGKCIQYIFMNMLLEKTI
jgi:hypothetical protein